MIDTLLRLYLGEITGPQVLAGRIQRGDMESIHAVIWFSDLRGFTALSGEVAPKSLIHTLNEVFDCQVLAIQKHGGEVLKFIGDGLFAIFPTNGAQDQSTICNRALDAATEAFLALGSLNERRLARGEPVVRFGLALHVGEVAYGNIGGAARLDFTCIGPAVNLAARLEGLTGKLGHDIVVSEAFAALTSRPMKDAGRHALKGITEPQRVFVPCSSDEIRT